MLQTIIDFFSGLYDIIAGILDFVITMLHDMVYFAISLAKIPLNIVSYISWIPAGLLYAVTGVISLIIVLRILGRD